MSGGSETSGVVARDRSRVALVTALLGAALSPIGAGCQASREAGTESPPAPVAAPATNASRESATPPSPAAEGAYLREIETWRARRETRLRDPEGYLALAGLFWLPEGEQTVGADPSNDCVLPANRAPAHVGTIVRSGTDVRFLPREGVAVTADEEPVANEVRLRSDADGREPTRVRIGELTFWLIDRGGQLGIRLRDPGSPFLRDYRGTDAFPTDPRWRLEARFVPHEVPRLLAVPNVLGTTFDEASPGTIELAYAGRTFRLQPTGTGPEDLFLVFGDETNGIETYGGGRFLRIAPPDGEGRVVLDFNRAYNPPCAYNPFTTCPLPPAANRLPFRVEAGERSPIDPAH